MRWLKHLSMAHEDPKMAELLETEGPQGYGIYWLLVELIAATLEPNSEKAELTHSERIWAQKLRISPKSSRNLLVVLSNLDLIKIRTKYDRVTIVIPNLLKYRDEYSKKSGQTPDKLRRDSGETPSQITSHHIRSEQSTAAAAESTIVEAPVAEPPAAAAAAAENTPLAQFPKTATLIRQSFPGTDQALIADIVAHALERKPDAGDEDVTAALMRTHKGASQRSAALWLKTVPAFLDVQARANPPPAEVCPACGDTGEIFNPKFAGQPNSAWLDLPHDQVWMPCPRCRGAPKKPNGAENGKENTAHGASGGTSGTAR